MHTFNIIWKRVTIKSLFFVIFKYMDKLIEYIEYRSQKYGVIKGIASVSSMYYQIGLYRVRISDHIKYSEDSLKECDFYFIIQPNDTYIFHTSPKYQDCGKVYTKIVTLNDAKAFIKSMNDFASRFIQMTDWYIPEDWNRDVKSEKRMTWEEFEKKYLKNKSDERKRVIINRMEVFVYGKILKGTLDEKYPTVEETYNNMTTSQYGALMEKIRKGK